MSAPTYDLGKLHGGLRLQGHKTESTAVEIQYVPIPDVLALPLTQHVGDPSWRHARTRADADAAAVAAGDKRVGAMVNVKQSALSAFEQQFLSIVASVQQCVCCIAD